MSGDEPDLRWADLVNFSWSDAAEYIWHPSRAPRRVYVALNVEQFMRAAEAASPGDLIRMGDVYQVPEGLPVTYYAPGLLVKIDVAAIEEKQ